MADEDALQKRRGKTAVAVDLRRALRRACPPSLVWHVLSYLSQPYLPLPPAPRKPPAAWCARCGECIGVGHTPHLAWLCSVDCKRCRRLVCMACWQRQPCPHVHDGITTAVYHGCLCWDSRCCTCGPTRIPLR